MMATPSRIGPSSSSSAPFMAKMPIPTSVNRKSATTCMNMSTSTVAPESAAGMPENVTTRAPAISPPTCATGNSMLIASRMKRTRTHMRNVAFASGGKMIHQPRPAPVSSTARIAVTTASP